MTDNLNYDTIYTERYLRLPKDDQKGYDESDVTKSADKLHGALLLVHGTGDDNVHFQNSVQMARFAIPRERCQCPRRSAERRRSRLSRESKGTTMRKTCPFAWERLERAQWLIREGSSTPPDGIPPDSKT